MVESEDPAESREAGDEPRVTYAWLTRTAPNRLTVSTFFAGFTLAAFVALFTVSPTLDHVDGSTAFVLLADVLIGASTLLFIVTAVATYIAMQRLTELSPLATELLSRDAGPLVLSAADATLLSELQDLYVEPGPFIVWGLLLTIAGILLVAWHIYPPVCLMLLIILTAILLRTRTLHSNLRRVLLRRVLPAPQARSRENPPSR